MVLTVRDRRTHYFLVGVTCVLYGLGFFRFGRLWVDAGTYFKSGGRIVRELKLDKVNVKTSFLTQNAHRAVPCELMLQVNAKNLKTAIAEFERTGELDRYDGLSLSGITDLSFLEKFPKLLYLEVEGDSPVDPRPLGSLSNLRGLYFETPKAGIDFACFSELEVYMGGWHKDFRNLATCQELRRLHLWRYSPPSGDLASLAGITRLEDLKLVQSGIENLDGVETLEDLRYLTIAYATKLATLDALAADGVDLRELSFEKVRRISSYRPLSALRRLRRLKLFGCAPMESLSWISALQHLDFFAFVDTEVLDAKVALLLELPRLRYAGWVGRKHYDAKWADLNAALKRRWETGADATSPPE